MKNFIQRMVARANKFTATDYVIFKVCLVVIGLWLATVIPRFTSVNPWIYFIIIVILGIYLGMKTFKK